MGQKVVVSAYGETPLAALESTITLVDMPPPEPSQLGANDVLIAIKSAGVGWVDLLMTSGQYQHMPQPPYVPGLEYAGTVDWTGSDVKNVAVGDAVLIDGFLAGPRSLGAYRAYGGFASFGVAPAEAVIKVPGTLSTDQAACLLGNYETAYHCLIARGRLRAGETVLILGASGATGLAAVQVAKLLGARVIAAGRSQPKLEAVKAEGADHVVNTSSSSLRDEVKKLTNGRGVEVVYDGVGGDASLEALRCVAFGARYLIVGWAATPFVAQGQGKRGAPNANQLPTNLIMMKGLDVLGCPTVISTVMDPSIRAARLQQVLAWAESGAIKPLVSHSYPLRDFKMAMRAKWDGAVVGNCVLHP